MLSKLQEFFEGTQTNMKWINHNLLAILIKNCSKRKIFKENKISIDKFVLLVNGISTIGTSTDHCNIDMLYFFLASKILNKQLGMWNNDI